MIAIVDYGVGNLYSLQCSLRHIGAQCEVVADPARLKQARSVVLPGVGAFGNAAQKLRESGMEEAVLAEAKSGKPLLGICLGMQLLYEGSNEYGNHRGLGLVQGRITDMTPELEGQDLKVPHMGWNDLHYHKESPLLKYVEEGQFVYFVHSFYAPVTGDTVASARYGTVDLTAITQHDNVYGTQFHPEKSGEVGLSLLRAFAEIQ